MVSSDDIRDLKTKERIFLPLGRYWPYLHVDDFPAPRINLGCGYHHLAKCINIDCLVDCEPDILLDFEKERLPFDDDSVNYVLACNVLEHLRAYTFVLGEIWRVCRHDALFQVIVPYCHNGAAFEDPTHVRFFGANSHIYMNARTYQGPKANTGWYDSNRFHFRLESKRPILETEERSGSVPDILSDPRFICHGVDTVHSLMLDMRAVKPLPEPEPRLIRVYE